MTSQNSLARTHLRTLASTVPEHAHWHEPFSGGAFDLLNPKPEQVAFSDMAISLARIPRYNGHTLDKRGYSVAEHSLWVDDYLYRSTRDPLIALHGLMHDAHEAYLGDISAPLKNIPQIKPILLELERKAQAAIYEALHIPQITPEQALMVAEADQQALANEAYHLKVSQGESWPVDTHRHELTKSMPIESISQDAAMIAFHARFKHRYNQCFDTMKIHA